jgi:cytochrome c biogenesis factor
VTQLGELSLWIALLMAAWCSTLSLQGALMKRSSLTASGARGLYASLGFTLLAAAGLMTAFIGDDYSLRYVAQHSGLNVETYYKLCAFWSDGAGQFLLASLLLGLVGSGAAIITRRRDSDPVRAAWTVAILGLVVAAALAITGFKSNPFAMLARPQQDGRGLDPILRHPFMLLQPPLMLFGAACALAPLAVAAGAALRSHFDREVLARIRAGALESWAVLSAGLLLGLRWAYVSPGLRAAWGHSAFAVTSVSVWMALTLFLAVMEFRRSPRSVLTEADLMRRRAGRALAAFGLLLCLATFGARSLTKNYDAQIADGEKFSARDSWGHAWTFTSQGASRLEREGDDVVAVALMPARDGVRQPFIASESRQYYGPDGLDIYPAQTVPGIRSTLAQDLFVVLSDAGEGRAVLRISFRPLIELVWVGGVLLALGGLLLFWPPRGSKTEFAT